MREEVGTSVGKHVAGTRPHAKTPLSVESDFSLDWHRQAWMLSAPWRWGHSHCPWLSLGRTYPRGRPNR